MTYIHDFDEPIDRLNTDSYKWDYEGENGKYIPLGVADTDFKAPQPIIDAIRQRVDLGVYAYGYLPQKRFSDAVCGWYRKRSQIELEPEAVRYSQGLMTGALWMLLDAYTRPGDKILVHTPGFSTFFAVIQGAGRFVECSDLILDHGRYKIDFDSLEQKTADPKVRILLVCNPSNPVGRVWTREELVRMYEICKKNNTLIISDEIHGDIVYAPHKHIPFFSLSEEVGNHVIVMGSPSKTFNLASFYSAYVVIKNKALRDQYDVVYDNYHSDYNYLGMEALIAAYNHCSCFVDQQNEYFKKNIELVKSFLGANMPEVTVIEPEATYLLWIDFRAWNLAPGKLMQLFQDAGVKLNDGAHYGTSGIGFVRMNVATRTAVLLKALECMKKAGENRPRQHKQRQLSDMK